MLRSLATALTLIASLSVMQASADDYPDRTITFVVASSPGGSIDTLGRVLAQSMSTVMGQHIIVENIGGAGGTIGTQRVTEAEADGYTLLFTNMSLSTYPTLYPDSGIDPANDLTAGGLVARVPMVMAASNTSGFTDVASILSTLRESPGSLTFGTGGSGSTGELAAVMFLSHVNAEAVIVPYKGMGPAIADLVAGHIDALLDQTPTIVSLHNSESVRALAVASGQRVEQLPDVPTMAEAGVPGFELEIWYTLLAPKATPRPVIERIEQAMQKALEDQSLQASFRQLGASLPTAEDRGGAKMDAMVASDVQRLSQVLATVGTPNQ